MNKPAKTIRYHYPNFVDGPHEHEQDTFTCMEDFRSLPRISQLESYPDFVEWVLDERKDDVLLSRVCADGKSWVIGYLEHGHGLDFNVRSHYEEIKPTVPPQPHTDDEYRAALNNAETPQPVKRAIKQHLYGAPGGRREVRTTFMRTHNINLHSQIVNSDRRPAGVSARQWKRERKAIHRIVKAIEAHSAAKAN